MLLCRMCIRSTLTGLEGILIFGVVNYISYVFSLYILLGLLGEENRGGMFIRKCHLKALGSFFGVTLQCSKTIVFTIFYF